MTGLLRLIFGPSIRLVALTLARPLQLVDEALADIDFDDDEPIPYVPAEFTDPEWSFDDACWLYDRGVKP